jgi:hypothetical protein
VLAPVLDRLGERRVALAVGRGEVEAKLLPEQAADLVRARVRVRVRVRVWVRARVWVWVRV